MKYHWMPWTHTKTSNFRSAKKLRQFSVGTHQNWFHNHYICLKATLVTSCRWISSPPSRQQHTHRPLCKLVFVLIQSWSGVALHNPLPPYWILDSFLWQIPNLLLLWLSLVMSAYNNRSDNAFNSLHTSNKMEMTRKSWKHLWWPSME